MLSLSKSNWFLREIFFVSLSPGSRKRESVGGGAAGDVSVVVESVGRRRAEGQWKEKWLLIRSSLELCPFLFRQLELREKDSFLFSLVVGWMDSPLVGDSSSSSSSSSLCSCRLFFRRCCVVWEKKRCKCVWSKVFYSRLLFCLLLFFVLVFRRHFYCLFGFLNCYLTWPFTSPLHVRLDLSNLSSLVPLSSSSPSKEWIPRRLHHILLGELSVSPPLPWLSARNSCLSLHPNFVVHYLWTDETGGRFLSENYSWFLPTWRSYSTNIQKADALRYFVLYHYGGIFLDMDLWCRQSLEGLLTYLDSRVSAKEKSMFFGVKAFPVGISNGFLICTRSHPLLRQVLDNLELYNRNFFIPHATIVISTGPMCLSIQIQLNRSLWSSIVVLDGEENMLGGKTDTPLFKHLGSGSWHQADERFFKNIPMHIQHQAQTFSISIILVLFFLFLLLLKKQKNNIKVSTRYPQLLRRNFSLSLSLSL